MLSLFSEELQKSFYTSFFIYIFIVSKAGGVGRFGGFTCKEFPIKAMDEDRSSPCFICVELMNVPPPRSDRQTSLPSVNLVI